MKTHSNLLFSVLAIFASIPFSITTDIHDDFLKCVSSKPPSLMSKSIYTPQNSSFLPILQSTSLNPRIDYASPPKVIITPFYETQIRKVVRCAKKHGMQIRVLSGGHDYEGLSYVSKVPFVIVDLRNLRSISISVKKKTAWVQAGATVGELSYAIANNSRTLGFVTGICPTMGVGGHFAGGGWGMMSRKFGLSADNIIDARIIDVNGRLLDRKSMGEDLFWAIRGAGSAGFGVITAWKIKLLDVPKNVTVSAVIRASEQNATKLIQRWQYIAPNLDRKILHYIAAQSSISSKTGNRTIITTFFTMFLGGVNKLLPMMHKHFPELGLVKEDFIEMSWIESVVFFYFGNKKLPTEILLNRTLPFKSYYKGNSDFVQQPIPENGVQGFLDWLHKDNEYVGGYLIMPLGGRMSDISESRIPFPHRDGNIYMINVLANWDQRGNADSTKHIRWIRGLYRYMTPFVSKNPRGAYINFRDLDLGSNKEGNTSYEQASTWGLKYFKNNFKRLAYVKTRVDPDNFFRNEQSIPPLFS